MMELDSGYCINCGSASDLMLLKDERILYCIRQWTAPLLVHHHDVVCTICWHEAQRTLSDESNIERNCALCNLALPIRKRSHQVIALRTDTQHHVNIKNIILERLMPLQVCASHFICHPCWQKADRVAKQCSSSKLKDISNTGSQLKCANCGINIVRMKRHILNDEQILSLIQQQSASQYITATDYICDACHTVFSERAHASASQDFKPFVGHTNICVQCGRSLAQARSHTVKESDGMCHRCFQRVQATARAILDSPVADPHPQAERITLLNYRRAPDTHARCIFPVCYSTSQQMVPLNIRVQLFCEHNYYIPPNCRICRSHLEKQSWSDLFDVDNVHNSFTAAYIEDFCELLKTR